MEKIVDIIEFIAYEKGLGIDIVQNIIQDEILKLAKTSIDPSRNYIVNIDKKEKTIKLFYKLKVVDNDVKIPEDKVNTLIHINEAKNISNSNNVFIGDELLSELNIDSLNLNRSVILNLLKDLESNIERSIENQIFDKLKGSISKITSGVVVSIDSKSEDTIIEIDSIRAKLSRKNRIKGEKFQIGQSVSCVLKNVYIDRKYGIQIELSRTTPKFLEELLRLEVPEINDGEVSIIKCSRIPGIRAKVAVRSNSPRVDCVGATVGVKGVRINEVSKKICGESIDVVEYSNVFENYLANALSPASIVSVKIEGDKAIISLYSDQKPKAIGKNGINIRLASMLLGMELDIMDIGENPSKIKIEDSTQDNIQNIQIPTNINGKELLESLFKS